MEKLFIRTTDEPVRHICRQDLQMAKLIAAAGDLEITLRSDYLPSLVRSIIGQQISVAAATAIYGRLSDRLGGSISAEGLIAAQTEDLRAAGLTARKAEYVKDLSEKVMTGELDLQHIHSYSDEEIIGQLVNVKGIGKWTAEMFLILTLGRMDVLAVDDVGIQRAAMWLYGTEKSERKNILIEKSPLFAPYRSVASFYLWEAIHLGFLSDYDSVDDIRKG